MRLAHLRFTIRSLMGVVALAALLIGGAILLLRDTAATPPPLPARPKSGVIMEGVDINWRPRGERQVLPRELLRPELRGGRRF
jgi:hypothetical protein